MLACLRADNAQLGNNYDVHTDLEDVLSSTVVHTVIEIQDFFEAGLGGFSFTLDLNIEIEMLN